MNSSASGGEDRDFGSGGQQGGILRQLSMNIKSSVARRRSSALSPPYLRRPTTTRRSSGT